MHGSNTNMKTYRLHRKIVRSIGLCALVSLVSCGPGEPPTPLPVETLEPWPFTVPEVALTCGPTPPGGIFVTTPDGRRFAVNGAARSEAPLMREIQGAVDLQPLIARGRLLCAGEGPIRLRAPQAAESGPAPIAEAPRFRIEDDPLTGGVYVISESQNETGGRRAELAIGCRDGRPNFISLNLITEPRTPPPLRGVFAEFDIGARTYRYEMSWGLNDDWILRSGDDRAEDTELGRAILAGGSVRMRAENPYMPSSVTWDLNGFGPELNRVQSLCGV